MKKLDFFENFVPIILLVALLLVSFAVSFGIPNGLVATKTHLANLFCICLIVYYAITCTFSQKTLHVNYVDILLWIYLAIVVANFFFHGLAYNENTSSLALSILAISILKQYMYEKRYYISIALLTIQLTSIGQIIYGQLQLLRILRSNSGNFSLTGSFHNPGPFAIFVAVVFVLSLGILLFFESRKTFLDRLIRIVASINILLGIIVLPATQSRTAWLAVLIGGIAALTIKYRDSIVNKFLSFNFLIRGFCIAVGIVGLGLVAYGMYTYKVESSDGRLLVWKIALHGFKEHPLVGIGFDQFHLQYGNFVDSYSHSSVARLLLNFDYVGYAFNDYIQILVENGILGLLSFLAVVGLAIKLGYDYLKKSAVTASLFGAMLAILVASFFSYPLELTPMWIVLLILLVVLPIDSTVVRISVKPSIVSYAFSVLLICATTFSAYEEFKLIRGKQAWQKADRMLAVQNYPAAITHYKAAMKDLANDPFMMLSFAKSLYLNEDYLSSIEVLKTASRACADPFLYSSLGNAYFMVSDFQMGEVAYRKSISITPQMVYPRYLLAKLLIEKGDSLKAQGVAEGILAMEIKIPTPASKQMLAEMKKYLDTGHKH